jgi:hypothetical protein
MITVNRRAYLEHTTPEAIFAALSDPDGIVELLPRMQKVEMQDRDDANCKAHLITYMSMGGIFGTIRCEGDLTWVEPHEILFKVHTPLPLVTHWTLTAAVGGADLQATMTLDLEPMLGPLAAFVPAKQVAEILGGELDAALKTITKKMRELALRERATAA